jgi:hypothetical protein
MPNMIKMSLVFAIACGDNIRPPAGVECNELQCVHVDAGNEADASITPDAPTPDIDAGVDTCGGVCPGDPQPDHGHEPPHAHDCK